MQRRDATAREESTRRRQGMDCFREGGCSRVPTAAIVFPLLKRDAPGGCIRVVARPGILDTISGGYGSREGWGTIKKMQINPNRPSCPVDRRGRTT